MTSQVVVALIASGGAMVTSTFTYAHQRSMAAVQRASQRELHELQYELGLQGRLQEQRLALEERLDRAGVPLLAATAAVRSRIGNILHNGFLEMYLHDPDDRRRRLAVLGTLHRFTNYWSLAGAFTGTPEAQALPVDAGGVQTVLRTLGEIERAFASDNEDKGGRVLMIWADEQRAIGELGRGASSSTGIGFADFFEQYESVFDPWLAGFRTDIEQLSASGRARLEALGHLLERLEHELRTSVPSLANVSKLQEFERRD